jgi:hypothetical protein
MVWSRSKAFPRVVGWEPFQFTFFSDHRDDACMSFPECSQERRESRKYSREATRKNAAGFAVGTVILREKARWGLFESRTEVEE